MVFIKASQFPAAKEIEHAVADADPVQQSFVDERTHKGASRPGEGRLSKGCRSNGIFGGHQCRSQLGRAGVLCALEELAESPNCNARNLSRAFMTAHAVGDRKDEAFRESVTQIEDGVGILLALTVPNDLISSEAASHMLEPSARPLGGFCL
jgi:hypothetical protein